MHIHVWPILSILSAVTVIVSLYALCAVLILHHNKELVKETNDCQLSSSMSLSYEGQSLRSAD